MSLLTRNVGAARRLCHVPRVREAPPAEDEPTREDGRVVRARALKVARRAQILTAARREFARRGYHATSMNDLLEAAGIARGTFYLHFDSKEAAFRAVLEDLLERITASLEPVDTRSLATAYDQLAKNLARAFGLVADDPDLADILFRQALGVSAETRTHLDAFYAGLAELAARSIRAGQTLGLVREGPTDLLSRLALGLMREAAALLGSEPHPDPDALARHVLDFALGGLLTDHKALASLLPPAKRARGAGTRPS